MTCQVSTRARSLTLYVLTPVVRLHVCGSVSLQGNKLCWVFGILNIMYLVYVETRSNNMHVSGET